MYTITPYTYKKAKQLGLVVKPSTNKTKKIDIYKQLRLRSRARGQQLRLRSRARGQQLRLIASVGAYGMNDFPTYIQKRGLKYAKTRRRLYRMRHERDRHIKWSRGWLADKLLW